MDGVGGLGGWQWIFILEGLVTVVGGVVAIFTIYNGPDSVSWLTDEEKRYLKVKLAYDGNRSGMGAVDGGSKWKYIKDAFFDWQVSIYASPVLSFKVPTTDAGVSQRRYLLGNFRVHLRACLWPTDHHLNTCEFTSYLYGKPPN